MKRIAASILGAWSYVYSAACVWALDLPNYASSGADLQSNLTTTGKTITTILLGVTVMIGIGGIIFSGMAFASGDGETGKTRLKNSVIGLVIAATAYGIAAVAIGK